MNSSVNLLATCATLAASLVVQISRADDAGIEFFEKRIRPVLIENCYECHNSGGTSEGGLVLDHRAGLLKGGDSGPAIVPGKPNESRLVQAMTHEDPDLQMPQDRPKLADAIIADVSRWIEMGAPDPRDKPPAAEELEQLTSWEAIRDRRKAWWSFQPVVAREPPAVHDTAWSDHPVDRFILARLEAAGLAPAPDADPATLIRRLSFVLTGLPPSPEEVANFVNDPSPRAYEELVDRYLDSPRFGERWARHWMDWFRYAESHGSEGDPAIPFAWRYRDYLIRALNDDVPYDRLIVEHLAGDLMPEPRINRELGLNESMLGLGHFRMVQHGYAPTDALDEQVRFTDNQIDVISKAMLGMTVSCARCHNHKFDPIGQRDFYALYGIMVSSRPALVTVESPERLNVRRDELTRLKGQIRDKLAEAWLGRVDALIGELESNGPTVRGQLGEAADNADHPLHAWKVLSGLRGDDFNRAWQDERNRWNEERRKYEESRVPAEGESIWNLAGGDYRAWHENGNGLSNEPAQPGEFQVPPEGDRVVAGILPGGVYTHLISSNNSGVLTSPRFHVEADELWVKVMGTGGARVRFVMQNYPRIEGPIYGAAPVEADQFQWVRFDLRYWNGDDAYVEVATGGDLPIDPRSGGRSWFGVAEMVAWNKGQPPELGIPLASVAGETRQNAESDARPNDDSAAALYRRALTETIEAWRHGTMTEQQARFLDWFVRQNLLPTALDQLSTAAPLVAEYRRLESELPLPTRAPGVVEGDPIDQPLFVRGNHKKPGDVVPRAFLEALSTEPYHTTGSGRLELAHSIVSADNPLTSRVNANRVWHHVFGRGIVATPDNLGRLGQEPSHPELLDYLAARFVEKGWSMREAIRFLVLSRTFRMSAAASDRAAEVDPDNALLSHFRVRRLEAEAIRDSILATSGQLDATMYGSSVPGNSRRRSVYVAVIRNDLDPFLSVFDAPEPLTTRGSRDATNVPAQSLTLLNDPWVMEQASVWAKSMLADSSLTSDERRIGRLFGKALGRAPDENELDQCRRFLSDHDRQKLELAQTAERIDRELAERRKAIEAILSPIRQRLLAERSGDEATQRARTELPRPIATWEFEGDLRDSVGGMHGTAEGNARVEDGALVLDGHSYVRTEPLGQNLREKTLEAWVRLDNLDQRGGGGVLSVESLDGVTFDSIVFAEREPRRWMAGSNVFARTQDFGAPPENEAGDRPVHVAIVYSADGTITGYREGKPYGKAYRSSGPVEFAAESSNVLFGLRHWPPTEGRYLKGRIERARLFDRALTPEQVATTSGAPPGVKLDDLLAALEPPQRAKYEELTASIERLLQHQSELEVPADWQPSPERRWQDLCHAIFNFKEFIYVR